MTVRLAGFFRWQNEKKGDDDEIPLTFFQSLIDQDLSNCFAQKPTDWQGVLQAATSGQNMLHETLKAN